MAPHRSYRRLARFQRSGAFLTALVLLALEIALFWRMEELSRLLSGAAMWLTSSATSDLSLGTYTYLGVTIHPLRFSLEPMDYQAVWIWFALSLVACWALFDAERLNPPLRLIGSFLAGMLALSALYMLFFGHLGYEGEAFSVLYVRTNVIVWLLLPVVVGSLTLILPFNPIERVLFVLVCFVCLFTLSTVRYALFIWVLTKLGSVFMPSLYLFLGPVLDFVYLMSVFALFLPRLGRRLDESRKEVWSWL